MRKKEYNSGHPLIRDMRVREVCRTGDVIYFIYSIWDTEEGLDIIVYYTQFIQWL